MARPRRVVHRASGKWRGSTLFGYMQSGDEQTYRENFRCSITTFLRVMALVDKHTPFHGAPVHVYSRPLCGGKRSKLRWKSAEHIAHCRAHCDQPNVRFKVACCLYALGQGGKLKVCADVASIGTSTLRGYLSRFCSAIVATAKPLYMPSTPPSAETIQARREKFGSRRGINCGALACDGTHIPFRPDSKKDAQDYKNYKGWTSILALAFVDSFYCFADVDVGFAGRAGDNTVLRTNWLMRAIKNDPDTWLGPGGVVLGDSGASDGDSYFLCPFHAPTEPARCWFNFCHSSTRFFVEETFGRYYVYAYGISFN